MALEKRPLVDVQVPIGDADGEVAERVGGDVDAAGRKTVALHRREGPIVADDLGDRIRRRHAASSAAIARAAWRDERSRSSSSSGIPAHSGKPNESSPGWVDRGRQSSVSGRCRFSF
jgi:hypothetical protein